MNNMQRDIGLLMDFQTAIGRIEKYVAEIDFDGFSSNEMIQDAVIRNITIIGEATTKLSDDLKAKHPNIEWHAIAGMRHRLVHDYNGVNLKLIWNTVKTMVPEFKVSVTKIQAEINVEDGSGGQASGGPSTKSVILKPR